MSVLPVGFGSQGGGGYTIENSLRFRSSASAYLSRTPATAGNRKTWTWSAWIKRGKQGVVNYILGTPSNYSSAFRFEAGGWFYFTGVSGTQFDLRTNQVFRDSSAWYHIIIAFDTTQATASNRIKIYVNGSEITSFSTASYPTLNLDGAINNNAYHGIGTPSSSDSHDGYLAEVNFIDGQALDPSSFGEYNADTGVWQPVAYEGTYGTNGFYLPFSDATNTTTLAADASGNGNDWTPNNISLTSGATYDSMTDTPTIYADGGNYAVLNPLSKSPTQPTFQDGNLYANTATSAWQHSIGTIGVNSGKWYWEVLPGGINKFIGIAGDNFDRQATNGALTSTGVIAYFTQGAKRIDGGADSAYGASYTLGDVIGVALDIDGGTVTFYKNNVSQGAISLSLSTLDGNIIYPFNVSYNNYFVINFGQRPFAYTPPTGFLPMHTGNLPDSAIVDGSDYFNTVLYTGTGPTPLSVTGVGFQPDFTWLKRRNNAGDHWLFDQVRGVENLLETSTTDEEQNLSQSLISFDANGFSLGTNTSYNSPTHNVVAWNWKAGTAFSNDAGTNGATIASVGSVNQDAGFSIVSYTGNGSGSATVGHGLNVKPQVVILKNRDAVEEWNVLHQDLGDQGTYYYYLELNTTTDKQASGTKFPIASAWNSSVFPLGTNTAINGSDNDLIAYCFAEVEGYSKMGKWQNNNSTDGTFVYLGFRPRFILLKNYDNAESWYIWDSVRQTYNVPPPSNNWLVPNESYSEAANSATTVAIDGLSNGFKIRTTNPATGEISFGTRNYIYMAFAENPFKNSLAR